MHVSRGSSSKPSNKGAERSLYPHRCLITLCNVVSKRKMLTRSALPHLPAPPAPQNTRTMRPGWGCGRGRGRPPKPALGVAPCSPDPAGLLGVRPCSPPSPLSAEDAAAGGGAGRPAPHRVGPSALSSPRCRCLPGDLRPHTKKPHPSASKARVPPPLRTALVPPLQLPTGPSRPPPLPLLPPPFPENKGVWPPPRP